MSRTGFPMRLICCQGLLIECFAAFGIETTIEIECLIST
jgi:hypothetical protein